MNLYRRAHQRTVPTGPHCPCTYSRRDSVQIATCRRQLNTALHTATQTWVCAAGGQLSHPLAGLAPVEMAALTNHERLSLPRCASSIRSCSRHTERRDRAGRRRVEPTKDTPHWHPVTDASHGEVESARRLRVEAGGVRTRSVTLRQRGGTPYIWQAGESAISRRCEDEIRHAPPEVGPRTSGRPARALSDTFGTKPRSAQLRLRPRDGVACLLTAAACIVHTPSVASAASSAASPSASTRRSSWWCSPASFSSR